MFQYDVLCRAAIYPSFIKEGVFDDELFVYLRPNEKKNPTKYSLSLASLWICRNEDGVHIYGHATALAITSARKTEDQVPVSFEDQRHYLGYYEIYYKSIVEAPLDLHGVSCFWKREMGQECHFQVEVYRLNENSSKSEIKADIRTFRAAIANSCWGPKLCHIDADSIRLIELQGLLPVRAKQIQVGGAFL